MLRALRWPRGSAEARAGTAGGAGRSEADHARIESQERNLRALLVVAATNNTAWNLITPFIPLLVLEMVDGDVASAAAWSGLLVGIAPLMTALAGPFWTVIAERQGARRAMLRTILSQVALVL